MVTLKYKWICFYLLLTMVMVILKATNVVDWSWWIIMLPLYLPAIFTILFFIVMAFIIYRNTK